MRSWLLRCAVWLLSLALIAGNAHAELHLSAMPHEPCPTEFDHHHGSGSHHRHDADRDACCCDCLGCAPAIGLTPGLSSFIPVSFTAAAFYSEPSPFLAGQILRPDPGPPRISALS
jgi:hypothetical protein